MLFINIVLNFSLVVIIHVYLRFDGSYFGLGFCSLGAFLSFLGAPLNILSLGYSGFSTLSWYYVYLYV
jgi:hypothetical protein